MKLIKLRVLHLVSCMNAQKWSLINQSDTREKVLHSSNVPVTYKLKNVHGSLGSALKSVAET